MERPFRDCIVQQHGEDVTDLVNYGNVRKEHTQRHIPLDHEVSTIDGPKTSPRFLFGPAGSAARKRGAGQ